MSALRSPWRQRTTEISVAARARLAGLARLDEQRQRAAFERAVRKAALILQPNASDPTGRQALELLEQDTARAEPFARS